MSPVTEDPKDLAHGLPTLHTHQEPVRHQDQGQHNATIATALDPILIHAQGLDQGPELDLLQGLALQQDLVQITEEEGIPHHYRGQDPELQDPELQDPELQDPELQDVIQDHAPLLQSNLKHPGQGQGQSQSQSQSQDLQLGLSDPIMKQRIRINNTPTTIVLFNFCSFKKYEY